MLFFTRACAVDPSEFFARLFAPRPMSAAQHVTGAAGEGRDTLPDALKAAIINGVQLHGSRELMAVARSLASASSFTKRSVSYAQQELQQEMMVVGSERDVIVMYRSWPLVCAARGVQVAGNNGGGE